jgi:hypothetical protein
LDKTLVKTQDDNKACFDLFVAGSKVWICSSEQNRAVAEARKLMKKIHELCMKVKLELGEISQKEFSAPASQ